MRVKVGFVIGEVLSPRGYVCGDGDRRALLVCVAWNGIFV